MKKLFFILMFFLPVALPSNGQSIATPIEKVDTLLAAEARPVLILLSTDWCKFCLMQKKQLRKNKFFRESLSHLYYVEFNAESADPVIFNHRQYAYRSQGSSIGLHELAEALNGSSQMAYPTWILLDTDYKVLYRRHGVLLPGELKKLLKLIREYEK